MNQKLVESLAQIILSLSESERQLLESQIHPSDSSTITQTLQAEILDIEKRLQTFESQYQMSSEEFYRRFRVGELGDAIDFFEWSVFYEMWKSAQNPGSGIGDWGLGAGKASSENIPKSPNPQIPALFQFFYQHPSFK